MPEKTKIRSIKARDMILGPTSISTRAKEFNGVNVSESGSISEFSKFFFAII